MQTQKFYFYLRIMVLIILCSVFLFSCKTKKNDSKSSDLEVDENIECIASDLKFNETTYVPTYSRLYYMKNYKYIYLTITLNIRNVSLKDKLFLTEVAYYDIKGKLIKNYLDHPLELNPLETKEFSVLYDELDNETGANFIVSYGANKIIKNQPIIEAINIGHVGCKGFAITTDSKIINE